MEMGAFVNWSNLHGGGKAIHYKLMSLYCLDFSDNNLEKLCSKEVELQKLYHRSKDRFVIHLDVQFSKEEKI